MIYFVCFTSKVCDEAWDRWPVKLLERKVPRLVRVLNDLSIDYLFGLLHFQSLWWCLRSMTCDAFGTESDSIVQVINDLLIDYLFCLLHFQTLWWGLRSMTYKGLWTESASPRAGYEWFIDKLFILFSSLPKFLMRPGLDDLWSFWNGEFWLLF